MPGPRAVPLTSSQKTKTKIAAINNEGQISGTRRVAVHRYRDWVKSFDPCVYCGADNDGSFTFDHVIPVSKGGQDANNKAVSCYQCNHKKSSRGVLLFLLTRHHMGLADPVSGCACTPCKTKHARVRKLAEIERVYKATMASMADTAYRRKSRRN